MTLRIRSFREALEKTFTNFFREAGAVIAYLETHFILLTDKYQINRGLRRGMFDLIIKKVGQHALHHGPISIHPELPRSFKLHYHSLFIYGGEEKLHHGFYKRAEFNRLQVKTEGVGLCFGDIQISI